MEARSLSLKQGVGVDVDAISRLILDTQRKSGEIPWSPGEKTDPWDHVEAAMGLTIGGFYPGAREALGWLADIQLDDGSWFASYRNGEPEDKTRDTNMSSYIAAGVYHYYLITGDYDFVREMWETVERAIGFALGMQAATGEIYWARSPAYVVDPVALLTGSSSVFFSIKCAMALAKLLRVEKPEWTRALEKLGHAIRNTPQRFNMTKSRFSMDWFYPILAGAVTGRDARKRIKKSWKKFVVEGQGVLCVSDESWVTLAETSELVLALVAMGNRDLAKIVFNWISEKCFSDGSYWCGHTVPDMTIWPEEKFTWTNAAVLLAADALFHLTPASRFFSHQFWASIGIGA
ncbi:MAG: phenyltransferase domain-containing protein [Desulfobacterales bacterium]|nr:phenyltransferase domain-containing protein [Desulfobacterales bacterium]